MHLQPTRSCQVTTQISSIRLSLTPCSRRQSGINVTYVFSTSTARLSSKLNADPRAHDEIQSNIEFVESELQVYRKTQSSIQMCRSFLCRLLLNTSWQSNLSHLNSSEYKWQLWSKSTYTCSSYNVKVRRRKIICCKYSKSHSLI